MATAQDALTGYRRKVEEIRQVHEEIRQVQDEAEKTREDIGAHFHLEAFALAELAARLAATTHSGLEEGAAVLDALVRENVQLREQLDRLKSRLATDDEQDDDADDHFFGTHLREAWSILRPK